jgi:plastocyanin
VSVAVRSLLLFSVLASASGMLLGEDVTLPAVASIVGGAPFFSDVRAFNTSYTDDVTVSARYRCFIPSACNPTTESVQFTLAPRESRAFNDVVVSLFQAPDTAGGVEFEYTGAAGQLVVTSRLYSTAPTPTVGMFIPGLPNSDEHPTTVLTSIRNRGAEAGFRTNVGLYNRADAAVNVTFAIFDAGAPVGNPVTRSVGGHSGAQVSSIFEAAGEPDHVTENAFIVVSATGPVFSYAAVIDNNTTDPIFVVGAQDEPPQPITPAITLTPTVPGATATQTPTITPTPPAGARTVNVGQGGSNFVDQVTGTNTTTISVGTEVNWVWVDGFHSTTGTTPAEPWNSGNHSPPFSFQHTFNQAGTFNYVCVVHGAGMSGTVIVNP